MSNVKDQNNELKIDILCKKVEMSRQNYYKDRVSKKEKEIDEELILSLVCKERQIQPRLGGRKVLSIIKKELDAVSISIGRDRFLKLLKNNNLLIEKKKAKPKTTNSRHVLPVFHNEIKNMEITAPNQVWVSDITYIRTREGFMYAALITDMFSRKIVGAHIGDNLETYGCIAALDKALSDLPEGKCPIHHSDRGSQYCCHEYVNRLKDRNMQISMTEANHCYENALAERVNGIIKQEYELDQDFNTKKQAEAVFYQGVYLYNYRRPHLSLKYQIPASIHEKSA